MKGICIVVLAALFSVACTDNQRQENDFIQRDGAYYKANPQEAAQLLNWCGKNKAKRKIDPSTNQYKNCQAADSVEDAIYSSLGFGDVGVITSLKKRGEYGLGPFDGLAPILKDSAQ